MKRFVVITILLTVTGALFLLSAPAGEVLGMPLTCVEGTFDGPCWITTMGVGVLALGGGLGLVEIGILGAGVFFATGQLAAGLMVMGQLAIGVVAFLGQVASGLVGAGQGAVGYLTVTQGGDNAEGKAFLTQLSAELDDVLRLW